MAGEKIASDIMRIDLWEQQGSAAQPQPVGIDGGGQGVIRPGKAKSNHFLCVPPESVPKQKLQLADFVSAINDAAQIIPLDVQIFQPDGISNLLQFFHQRRKPSQRHMGKLSGQPWVIFKQRECSRFLQWQAFHMGRVWDRLAGLIHQRQFSFIERARVVHSTRDLHYQLYQ